MAETRFTLGELKKHNGVTSALIYVALKGTVFDVTSKGQEFYGAGKFGPCVIVVDLNIFYSGIEYTEKD